MRFFTLSLLVTVLLVGCGTQQPVYHDNSDMEVSVVLRSVHRCSRISPEIEIFNPPANTANFEVILQDRTDVDRMHGGGVWRNDGSGIIPEGALNRHYVGACPPAGTSRSYQYVVKALDSQQNTLVTRHYIFEQE